MPLSSAPSVSTGFASSVIFDLDGTLVDPAGAITGGIAAALAAHRVPVPSQQVLDSMVGPPLLTSLKALPGVTQENVASIMDHYRSSYLNSGMAASKVYPGIRELLQTLGEFGVARAVATSKPEPLAHRLLEVQGLAGLIDSVHGSHPDETVPHSGKTEIVAAALSAVGADGVDEHQRRDRVVMVGDRIFDVAGAHAHGLRCIGVTWGYAPDGELEAAGADHLAADAAQLADLLQQLLGLSSSLRSALA